LSATHSLRAGSRAPDPPRQAGGLRIVVIAGEDAVNVVQQRTSVAPVVEVRDRNDQPVAGAVVRFAIRRGRASFAGGRTLSVTTDAAGRATGTSLAPSGAGTLQITASTNVLGQTAAVTITQMNVMTLAEVAGVGAAAGAGGAGTAAATGAGGAAAGGGVSATTLGIVAGAVAGGALATRQIVAGGPAIYEGPFRIDGVSSITQTQGNGQVSLTCAATLSFTGEVRAEIDEQGDGTLAGTVSANGFVSELSRTCPFSSATSEKLTFGSGPVSGTNAGFQATGQFSDGVGFSTMSFVGALNDGVITGTFTYSNGYKTVPNASGFFSQASFPATGTPVTLTR
jgi:hypothetical protein